MNQSRNRKSNFLTTLALGAAGLVGLAGCETTNRRETPTPLETLLRRELGVGQVTQAANAARNKTSDDNAAAVYRVLQNLGNTPADNEARNAIVGALENVFTERMTRYAAPGEATPTQTRMLLAPYLDARTAPGFEKNDGSEMIVNLPGPKSGKLNFVNGKFTTFATINDGDLPAALATDYFSMQARLENGKRSLVTAADAATVNTATTLHNYFTPNADVATLASDSLAARAMRTTARGKFGANDNLDGELLYSIGAVGSDTVYGLQTADGRTRITATDIASSTPARDYALGEGKDLRVRVVYTATDTRQEGEARNRTEGMLSPADGPRGRQLYVRLEDLYNVADEFDIALSVEGVGGRFNSLVGGEDALVERLYAANPAQKYAHGSGDIPALGITFVNPDLMQLLVEKRKIMDKNNQPIDWLTMPGANYTDLHTGLQLYRRDQNTTSTSGSNK